MIDTISFLLCGSEYRNGLPIDFTTFKQKVFRQRGIIVSMDRRGYIWVTLSLPRFAYGNNGTLIVDQAALDAAWQSLLVWLDQTFTTPTSIRFSRVDLCCHVAGDIPLDRSAQLVIAVINRRRRASNRHAHAGQPSCPHRRVDRVVRVRSRACAITHARHPVNTCRYIGYYGNAQWFGSAYNDVFGATPPPNNTFVTEAVTYNPSVSSNNVVFYRNGVQTGTTTMSGVSNTTPGIWIGSADGSNFDWQGDLSEVLIYDHQLSTTEYAQVDGYLADKYGFYDPNATWTSTYTSVVQGEITRFHWNKAQADAYAAGLGTNTAIPNTGLAVWLKPDAGLNTSGTNVTSWTDQTPNQNTANPSGTPPTVVTGGLGGYSAVHFDGSGNNFLAIADNPSVRPNNVTILAVAKENSIGNSQYLVCRPYYNNSGFFYGWDSPFISYAAILDDNSTTYLRSYITTGGVPVSNEGANTYNTSQPHEFSWRYDGTNQEVYYDGRSQPSTSTPTTGNIDYSGGSVPLTIGNHDAEDLRGGSTIDPLNGDVYEILIYARALTDAERQQAETYLANKYGLYNPHATWPSTYSPAVQAEIAKHPRPETQLSEPDSDFRALCQSPGRRFPRSCRTPFDPPTPERPDNSYKNGRIVALRRKDGAT